MKPTLTTCLLLAFAMLPPVSNAEEQYVVRRAVEAGQLKPLSEILAAVQTAHPGKVLDVDLERDRSGRRVYEITILKGNGQRAKILIDAVTGSEVRQPPEPAARQPVARMLRNLLARHPGHVLELELKTGADNRPIYEIQLILLDGRLREFVVDAQSGELIDGEGHRREVLSRLRPLPDILERLPARYRGAIQEAELEYDQDGKYFYEIEIRLADGRTIELDVDAITGDILNGEEVAR